MARLALAGEAFLTQPLVSSAFKMFMRNRATIFMLHRFHAPELGVHEGLDPGILGKALALLRRRRFELVSLAEITRRLQGDGAAPAGAVAFTIDDGYLEQAEAAGPVFEAYDCPATIFTTTGFLDGALWFWWDQIAFVLRETRRPLVQIAIEGERLDLPCGTAAERAASRERFTEWCKGIPHDVKIRAIPALAEAAGVELPAAAPPGHQPVSWDGVRRWEKRGLSFGPHTVTHPVLSRTTDEVSRFEITESWRRLSAEASSPVKIFCYPNGRDLDFGMRETATLRELGFQGAVVGTRGYPARFDRARDPEAPFRLRRVEFPELTPRRVIRYVSGLERVNLALRGHE